MSWFPSPVGPRAAFRDLRAFMRQRSREQTIGATLALLSTIIVIILFTVDSKINTAPKAQLVYVDSWSADRTDEEIIEQQKKDQIAKREAQLERQRQFQKIQKQFGIE
ncbi:MAG TPA: hypothetical protein VMK31_03130 [Sphingomicrobium sp.]|nr:hypothetical protein [Sphingomicrobium sp.]